MKYIQKEITNTIFHYANTLKYYEKHKAKLSDLIAETSLVNWNEIQIDYSAPVTLKFDRWPLETIGNIFHASKSYVCHFIAIHEFKLELLSGKNSNQRKIINFLAPVTLKFERWPWKIIRHLFYAILSFVHQFCSHLWIQVRKCDLEIWQMTSKTIRFLFCATSNFVNYL